MRQPWVIYGSYGYTGNLIAERAAQLGVPVVLSGRNGKKLAEQAKRLKFEYCKADLSNEIEMDKLLKTAKIVIHCAGPFKHTWHQMTDACLRNNCHYLDITGEIEVFEGVRSRGDEFQDKGLLAMAGVGFDVVPSDCLAAYLRSLQPDAERLEMTIRAFGGGYSRGTAKTVIENLGEGGAVRKEGDIVSVPSAYKVKNVRINGKNRTAITIPWGDVSTAYYTTAIPNIEVYAVVPKRSIRHMKWSSFMSPILKLWPVRKILHFMAGFRPAGPDPGQRETGRSVIHGIVYNAKGEPVTAQVTTSDGYTLTSETALLIAGKISKGHYEPGFHTPAGLYGYKLILEIKGTELIQLM